MTRVVARIRLALILSALVVSAVVCALALRTFDTSYPPGHIASALTAPGFALCFMLLGEHPHAPYWLLDALVVAFCAAAWTALLVAAAWATLFAHRCVRGPDAARARRIGIPALAAFGLLWALTAVVGRRQLVLTVRNAVRDTVTSARPREEAQLFDRQGSTRSPGRVAMPYYYADAIAPFPLLVRVDSGWMAAALWGQGERVWYLWLLGVRVRIVRTFWWVS